MTPTAIRKRLSRVRKSEHQKQAERDSESDAMRRQISRAKQDELDPVAAGLRRERDLC